MSEWPVIDDTWEVLGGPFIKKILNTIEDKYKRATHRVHPTFYVAKNGYFTFQITAEILAVDFDCPEGTVILTLRFIDDDLDRNHNYDKMYLTYSPDEGKGKFIKAPEFVTITGPDIIIGTKHIGYITEWVNQQLEHVRIRSSRR